MFQIKIIDSHIYDRMSNGVFYVEQKTILRHTNFTMHISSFQQGEVRKLLEILGEKNRPLRKSHHIEN